MNGLKLKRVERMNEKEENKRLLEELQEKDAYIEKLLVGKNKLKQKIKDLKDAPDINVLLIDCVSKLLQVNCVLKDILDNVESLNAGKLAEFEDAIKRTFKIIKDAKNNGNNDQMIELAK